MSPGSVLLLLINKISKMHIFTNDSSVQSDVDTTRDGPSNPSGANDQTSSETDNITDTSSTSTSQNNNDNEAETPGATSTTQGNTEQGPTDPHPAEAGFSHIINFLYECLSRNPHMHQTVFHRMARPSTLCSSVHTRQPPSSYTSPTAWKSQYRNTHYQYWITHYSHGRTPTQ